MASMTQSDPVDVIVIGAMRAGTTALYELLAQLPQVSVSRKKETDFFTGGNAWERGLGWYGGQFAQDGRLRIEVSPNYTKRRDFPGVPKRVSRIAPNARFVFIARDPLSRARSHYAHSWLSEENFPTPDALYGSQAFAHIAHVSRYGEQLAPWLEIFGQERFLFLQFERLMGHGRTAELARLAHFIGLQSWPEEVSLDKSNSSNDLAELPSWYFRLRDGPLGQVAQQLAGPRTRTAVKAIFRGKIQREVPKWHEALERQMREAIEDGLPAFLDFSGLDPALWPLAQER